MPKATGCSNGCSARSSGCRAWTPPGVGARSLAECLTLQLRAPPQTPAHALAAEICRQHLDLLARREFKKLSAATGADEAQLREARELIVRCDPKPGRAVRRKTRTPSSSPT